MTKLSNCPDCGVELVVHSRARTTRCTECRKEKYRRYAREQYQKAVRSGKVLEYRAKAAAKEAARLNADPRLRLLGSARARAKHKGVACDLVVDDIAIPTVCPILGVPLVKGTYYAPSIDAIDPTGPYTKSNIQVISHKANAMKNNATVEELVAFATWVLTEVAREPKVEECKT